MIIWFAIFTVYLMSMTVLFGCDGGQEVKGPVIQPKKESTWVRTEKVQTTKEEVFSTSKKELAKIPINPSIIEKILTKKFSSVEAIDKTSCLDRFESLDLRRTLVQKLGGMWGAFERNEGSKSYSFHGMQLDSNINKIIIMNKISGLLKVLFPSLLKGVFGIFLWHGPNHGLQNLIH